MPNNLQKVGAQPSRPARFGVLWHNNFYLGMVTQRNPLHSYLQHIEEEFYGNQPALIGGSNTEVSTKLTLIRRPGHSVYNSSTFPTINRFYENRLSIFNATQTTTTESIQIVADCAPVTQGPFTFNISSVQVLKIQTNFSIIHPTYTYYALVTFSTTLPSVVYGQTFTFSGLTGYTALNGHALIGVSSVIRYHLSAGPNQALFSFGSAAYPNTPDTGIATVPAVTGVGTVRDVTGPSTNKVLFSKTAGAGTASFQSVGNTLYFSDGPDQEKLITPNLIWSANQTFNTGNQVLDTNGNLQIVQGTGTATITEIAVISSTLGVVGGPTQYFLQITFSSEVFWTQGTLVTFSGVTTYTSINGQTQTVVVNPTYLPPGVNTAYFTTAAITTYGPAVDTGTATSTNSTGSGTSGGTTPSWSPTIGGFTTDGDLTWQNFGIPLYNWAVPPPTLPPTLSIPSGNRYWQPNFSVPQWYSVLDQNNHIQFVSSPGITGTQQPVWSSLYDTGSSSNGVVAGSTTDGTVTWLNAGPLGTWQADTTYYVFQCILDSNGNIQIAESGGTSGGSAPVWNTTIGVTTTDNTITWVCAGPGHVIITGNVYYGYSWVSTDGSVTTSSPVVSLNINSAVLGPAGNPIATVSGSFPADQQVTQAWVWRSVQGGSAAELFFDSAQYNPTPGAGSNWSFNDVIPDVYLNELIQAPLDDQNDPPPVGLTALAYHLNRVWGSVGNIVFSSQTSGIVGNPYTAWDPGVFFTFPDTVVRLWPTSNGLLVFTVADIFVIQGLGDASSSFFSTPFLQGTGLANYDAFTVKGAIPYFYTTDNQVLTIDPSTGLSEVGAPVGDQFGPNNGTNTFLPSTARLTWNFSGSQEKALYVSDFSQNWWRMLPTPSPETGTTWCPMATIVGGFSAVQSVETSPGIHNLLLGPQTTGPILMRDPSVYSDNGSSYSAYTIIGSIVLAQPGQLAYIKLLTTDCQAVGTPITLEVQLDEIAPLSSGYFEPLTLYVPDPTQLTAPNSLYAQRFYMSQTQQPAVCRHFQVLVSFGTDVVKNELLSLSIFGAYDQED
jgi:hypothetical protein